MAEGIVLDFPSPTVEMRQVRSTVLLSSVGAIRDAGHIDAYLRALRPELHDALLNTIAGVWMPASIAHAHYEACDALGLGSDAQAALGRATFDRAKGTLLGTVTRLAQNTGVTPWTIYPHFQRFWLRGYDGGGVRVTGVGPKEAHIDIVKVSLLDTAYYRNAVRGLVTSVISLFCRQAYLQERRGTRRLGEASFRAQWV